MVVKAGPLYRQEKYIYKRGEAATSGKREHKKNGVIKGYNYRR
jgi:hypothetical protein